MVCMGPALRAAVGARVALLGAPEVVEREEALERATQEVGEAAGSAAAAVVGYEVETTVEWAAASQA